MKLFAGTATGGADSNHCFRSYSRKHTACRGRLHVHDYAKNIDDCCKRGQGYAAEVEVLCIMTILISIFGAGRSVLSKQCILSR